MVYATKYKLLIAESKKDGLYRNTGQAHEREFQTNKVVPRLYVEERNAAMNAELWVIDEEKTKELDAIREQNLIKQAHDKKNASATMGDLVNVLGNALAGKAPKTVQDNTEVEALKKQLAEAQKALEKVLANQKKQEELQSPEQIKPLAKDASDLTTWSIEELKQYCDDNGIKYHHATKESGLIKLIEANNEN